MWPVSAQFLPALAQSHRRSTRIEAWYGGSFVAVVEPGTDDTASVTVTARQRVRRTLSLTVAESLWPSLPTDPLSPYGAELRVYSGLDFGGTSNTERPPVFRGRIDKVGRTRKAGKVQVTCSDRFATINDARFTTPRAAPAGDRILSTVAALIVEVCPDASVIDLVGTDNRVPAGLAWDRDRGQAIDDLAKSCGGEVVATPDGNFVIQPVPRIDTATPVWAVTDGANGTVVADAQSLSREGVYNTIVVLGERTDGTPPLRVVVSDTNPASPTYVNGPFGQVVGFFTSQFLTDEAQAGAAGRSVLARSLGAARQRTVTVVPNAALDAGDVFTVAVGGEAIERHIADSFTIPLFGGDAMTIATRSTRVDGEVS